MSLYLQHVHNSLCCSLEKEKKETLGRRSQKRAAKRSAVKAGTAPRQKHIKKNKIGSNESLDSEGISDEENEKKDLFEDGESGDSMGEDSDDDAPLADNFKAGSDDSSDYDEDEKIEVIFYTVQGDSKKTVFLIPEM